MVARRLREPEGSLHMRKVMIALVSSLLLVSVASAQVEKQRPSKDDAVPLRNWAVNFERQAPVVNETGKFVATTNAVPTGAMTFVAILPCRVLDTRNANQGGGGLFNPGEIRTYNIPTRYNANVPSCGTLPSAAAYSLNVTVAAYSGRGAITAWPADGAQPGTSIVNLGAGLPVGDAAIVAADAAGNIKVALSNVAADPGHTQVVIDINGYFLDNASSAATPNTLVLRDGTGSINAVDINASGNITGAKVVGAVYQDLAEWVPSTPELKAGMVVTLDPADGHRVVPSSHSYDTAVAGVVSANPGIILGVGGPEKSQIATTGRVKVMVDASTAPIRVGDLLVTSDTPGVAMRSMPVTVNGQTMHRPGTIIGKAMQPLASGSGEIMVLLSMQ